MESDLCKSPGLGDADELPDPCLDLSDPLSELCLDLTVFKDECLDLVPSEEHLGMPLLLLLSILKATLASMSCFLNNLNTAFMIGNISRQFNPNFILLEMMDRAKRNILLKKLILIDLGFLEFASKKS
jgi:hypothetical protein